MSLRGLKVIFMGTPVFAVPTLKALINAGCDIRGVVTRPDRPAGRGRKVEAPPVKKEALSAGLQVFQPLAVKESSFVETLASLSADVAVVVAYGHILPAAVLEIPPMGCVNVHASLLPAYRGAAPINWAVANGETLTGVTTILMDEGMDTGDILLKEEIAIEDTDDAHSLYDRLASAGAGLLVRTLEGLKNSSIKGIKQDEAGVSYAPVMKKKDGLINWNDSAENIVNLVRGMLPWPTAHTRLRGKGLKIFSARTGTAAGRPGTVVNSEGGMFEIAAGKGSVVVHELQLEGKRRMMSGEFMRGVSIEAGEVLGG